MNTLTINTSVGSIAVYQNRENGFPIIFIHGNSLSSDTFLLQLTDNNLSEFRLIALDLPGHGKSFKSLNPEKDYTPETYVKVLVEVCFQLSVTSGILIGHSLGGHIAIEAIPYLKELKGILITGTPPLAVPPQFDKAFLPNPILNLAFKADLNDSEKKLLAGYFVKTNVSLTQKIYECICKTDPLARHYIGNALTSTSGNNEVQIILDSHKKIALLHGEYDQFVNIEYLNQLPKFVLWNKKVHIISNAGHTPQLEQPVLFNTILKQFADNCLMEN